MSSSSGMPASSSRTRSQAMGRSTALGIKDRQRCDEQDQRRGSCDVDGHPSAQRAALVFKCCDPEIFADSSGVLKGLVWLT